MQQGAVAGAGQGAELGLAMQQGAVVVPAGPGAVLSLAMQQGAVVVPACQGAVLSLATQQGTVAGAGQWLLAVLVWQCSQCAMDESFPGPWAAEITTRQVLVCDFMPHITCCFPRQKWMELFLRAT